VDRITTEFTSKENYGAIKVAIFLLVPILILTAFNALSITYLIVFSVFSLFFLFIFNFEIVLFLFISSMFIEVNILFFTLSEILSILVVLSFFITHIVSFSELKNPFQFPFFIFLVSIIPSIINSDLVLLSGFLSLRLILFFLLFTCLSIYFNNYSKINFLFITFLLISSINALYLIFESASNGRRAFGFTGIMYVDLVGISLVISTIFFIYKKKRKLLFFLLTILFVLALLFTQTRNAWLSAGVTVFAILIQNTFKTFKENKSISRLFIKVSFFLVPIIVLIIFLSQSNLAIFERVNLSSFDQGKVTGETLKTTGSFISRFFIWDTAFNAFFANPYTGIGIYSFPFLSIKYSTLDPILYKMFVELLPPHQTFIAILCETGIIGFLGFIIFISFIVYQTWKFTTKTRSDEEKIYATLLFWLIIYIVISMLMTDAWLWGDLFMIWSVVLALTIANNRIGSKKLLIDGQTTI